MMEINIIGNVNTRILRVKKISRKQVNTPNIKHPVHAAARRKKKKNLQLIMKNTAWHLILTAMCVPKGEKNLNLG